MGQEQGKATMSEPLSFPENSTCVHSLFIKNRFLLYENNYLRCINNLLSEIGQGDEDNDVNFQFAEPNRQGDEDNDVNFQFAEPNRNPRMLWPVHTKPDTGIDSTIEKGLKRCQEITGKQCAWAVFSPNWSQKDCDKIGNDDNGVCPSCAGCEFLPGEQACRCFLPFGEI